MNAAPLNVRPEAINAVGCTMVPAVHPRCGRAGEVGPCAGSIRKRSPAPARRAAGISRLWKALDRKSVVMGKSVSVRVEFGGGRILKKKKTHTSTTSTFSAY